MRMTAITTPPGGSALLSWYAVLLQLLLNTCVLLQAVRSAKLSNLDDRYSALSALAAVCGQMQTNQLSLTWSFVVGHKASACRF